MVASVVVDLYRSHQINSSSSSFSLLGMSRSVVDRSRITLVCGAELLWVAFCCAAVQGAGGRGTVSIFMSWNNRWRLRCLLAGRSVATARSLAHSPDFLLRPFKISLRFLCSSHALCEIRPCLGQTCSCLGLESEELAVFGIELAGPWELMSVILCLIVRRRLVSRRSRADSHLRLSGHILIQWDGVVSLGEAVVHVVEEIDAGGSSS